MKKNRTSFILLSALLINLMYISSAESEVNKLGFISFELDSKIYEIDKDEKFKGIRSFEVFYTEKKSVEHPYCTIEITDLNKDDGDYFSLGRDKYSTEDKSITSCIESSNTIKIITEDALYKTCQYVFRYKFNELNDSIESSATGFSGSCIVSENGRMKQKIYKYVPIEGELEFPLNGKLTLKGIEAKK